MIGGLPPRSPPRNKHHLITDSTKENEKISEKEKIKHKHKITRSRFKLTKQIGKVFQERTLKINKFYQRLAKLYGPNYREVIEKDPFKSQLASKEMDKLNVEAFLKFLDL